MSAASRFAGKTYEEIFQMRIVGIFSNQQRRAKKYGQKLDYSSTELAAMARRFIGRACLYCGFVITEETFSFDHAKPVSLGGSFSIENLHVPCESCNLAKSALTAESFRLLVNALADIEEIQPGARAATLNRLKLGGQFKQFTKWRAK